MSKKVFLLGVIFAFILVGALSTQTGNASNSIDERVSTTIDEITDPGMLPDSPFYFLKGWWESIQLTFTFDSVKKAELFDKLASRKLLEAQKLVENGNTELAEKHMEKFENRVQKMQEQVEKAQENGKDIDELIEKLGANSIRQQEVLSDVYEKVPEQAQEAILKAMERSTEGLKNAIEKVQGTEEAEQFREEVKEGLENMGEDTKNQIENKLQFLKGNNSNEEDDSTVANENSNSNGNENSNANENVNENSNTNSEVDDDEDELELEDDDNS